MTGGFAGVRLIWDAGLRSSVSDSQGTPGTMLVAADNDILAVTTAAENARINHLPPLVKAVLSQAMRTGGAPPRAL